MDLKAILNDAIAELNESNLPVLIGKSLPEVTKMAKTGGERLINSDLSLAKLLGGTAAAGAGAGGVGAAIQKVRDDQAAEEVAAAEEAAAKAEAARLANRTPLEKARDMAEEGYEKAKDALSGAYDYVDAQVRAHPEMAVAIPGALLAGAGALALRRRQMAAKNQ